MSLFVRFNIGSIHDEPGQWKFSFADVVLANRNSWATFRRAADKDHVG
jgi:hypothetical protein